MLIIGERLNAEGSRAVKRLLLARDVDGLLAIGRQQIADGADALDVCVALKEGAGQRAGASEADTFAWLLPALSTLGVPLAIDSPNPESILQALPHVSGPVILNSISLATPAVVFDAIVAAAIEHRAVLVALCHDDEGLARTAARKLSVARRLVAAVQERGLPLTSLLVDPLVLPGQGDATLEGIRAIRAALPGVRMVAGISDVSFGMPAAERPAVNAAFFAACVEAGLDAAIMNPEQASGSGPRASDPGSP